MTKIKLPPAVLNGTPLTESEMKEILGGMQFYAACSCTVYKNGEAEDHELPMTSGMTCADACKAVCDKINENTPMTGTSCSNYNYTYIEKRY